MSNKNGYGLRGISPDKIEKLVCQELRKSFEREVGGGVPMWSNILYLLQVYNRGDFIGNLSLRIVGNMAYDVRIHEQEIQMEEHFLDLEKKLC